MYSCDWFTGTAIWPGAALTVTALQSDRVRGFTASSHAPAQHRTVYRGQVQGRGVRRRRVILRLGDLGG